MSVVVSDEPGIGLDWTWRPATTADRTWHSQYNKIIIPNERYLNDDFFVVVYDGNWLINQRDIKIHVDPSMWWSS